MAAVAPAITEREGFRNNSVTASWDLADADTGNAVENPGYQVRSVQIEGTFGGATVVVQGSNDGTNFQTLNDLQGSAISKTAAALEGIAETTRYIRASSSGGTGTAVVVTLLMVRRGS